MQKILKIFVAEDCPGCIEARSMATHIEQTYPNLAVEVVDINHKNADVPEKVFATPTYMLNNRVVSLGNPKPDEIAHWANRTSKHPGR